MRFASIVIVDSGHELLETNGLSLYYEEHGTGEPLVLLHGGIGSGEMFAPGRCRRSPPSGG